MYFLAQATVVVNGEIVHLRPVWRDRRCGNRANAHRTKRCIFNVREKRHLPRTVTLPVAPSGRRHVTFSTAARGLEAYARRPIAAGEVVFLWRTRAVVPAAVADVIETASSTKGTYVKDSRADRCYVVGSLGRGAFTSNAPGPGRLPNMRLTRHGVDEISLVATKAIAKGETLLFIYDFED